MIRIEAVWLALQPVDMRAGTGAALTRIVNGFSAARPHHASRFANRRANRMKVLEHGRIGAWLAARRLKCGRSSMSWCWVCIGSASARPASTGRCSAAQLSNPPMAQAGLGRRAGHRSPHRAGAQGAGQEGLETTPALQQALAEQPELQLPPQRGIGRRAARPGPAAGCAAAMPGARPQPAGSASCRPSRLAGPPGLPAIAWMRHRGKGGQSSLTGSANLRGWGRGCPVATHRPRLRATCRSSAAWPAAGHPVSSACIARPPAGVAAAGCQVCATCAAGFCPM